MENRNKDEGILAERKCTAFPGVYTKYEPRISQIAFPSNSSCECSLGVLFNQTMP